MLRTAQRILEAFNVPLKKTDEQMQKLTYKSNVFKTYSQDIRDAIRNRGMVVIAGKFMSGKSTLFRDAVEILRGNSDKAPAFVHVMGKDRQRLRIGHVLTAIILDLAPNENVRQDMEARSRQAIRIIGEHVVQKKREVCIVVENAHGLHLNTVQAIKDLREDEYAGKSELFSVALIGQELLATKIRQRKEVYWRSHLIELSEAAGWFNHADRLAYIEHVYGQALNPGARERAAMLFKLPGEIDFEIESRMVKAYNAGFTQLDATFFEMSMKYIKDSNKVSYREIKKELERDGNKIGMGTIQAALNGELQDQSQNQAVRSALERAVKKMQREQGQEQVRRVA